MGNFSDQLQKTYESLSKDSAKKLRGKAWEKYLQLGLPTKKSESYQYVKLPLITQGQYCFSSSHEIKTIDPYVLPECKNSVFVFVNGTYSEELSRTKEIQDKIVSMPLSKAAISYSAFLNNQWNESVKAEKDPFAFLNGALHLDGLFLLVPPDCILDTPVQILHLVNTGTIPTIVQPRLHLFAGKNSESSFIFQTKEVVPKFGTNPTLLGINQVYELTLDENAQVKTTQISDPLQGWHLDAFRATLKRASRLKNICSTSGSLTTRHDYRIRLVGEQAEVDLKGIAKLEGKKEAHTYVFIEHEAPHCRSNQEFRAVLKGVSRSSFEGKIYVHPDAQKTEAYQLNNNLLLDDRSIAYSKPNLEIFADDVKASHGATVGQLDPEQLFYLKTRGFSHEQAQEILIEAFCSSIWM